MANFILGVIFSLMIIPIIDGITSLVLTFLEMLKSYISIIIMKNNHKIQNPEEVKTNTIGFVITKEEEEEANDNI